MNVFLSTGCSVRVTKHIMTLLSTASVTEPVESAYLASSLAVVPRKLWRAAETKHHHKIAAITVTEQA